MIVSHRHQFVFFAVPKTATHAIRQALSGHMGPDDWEQQVLFAKRSLPIPQIAAIQHGHVSAEQFKEHVTPEIWKSYFKFAFVRNPFDRYVSACFFLHRNNPAFAQHARRFMKQALHRVRFQQRILIRPQSELLCLPGEGLVMDYVGRYENLQQSYDTICQRIGIPTTNLERKNRSVHSLSEQYYDIELSELVRRFYAGDFDLFDYDRGESAR